MGCWVETVGCEKASKPQSLSEALFWGGADAVGLGAGVPKKSSRGSEQQLDLSENKTMGEEINQCKPCELLDFEEAAGWDLLPVSKKSVSKPARFWDC